MARGYRNEAFQELSEGIVHGSGEESHFKLVTFLLNTQHLHLEINTSTAPLSR